MDGFKTPRRPSYRVTKPQSRGAHTQSWTASRCQRLLRPLLSRVVLLRGALASQTNSSSTKTSSVASEKVAKRPVADCSWLVPRKKLRRTYSQRCAGKISSEVTKQETVRFKPAKYLQRDVSTGETVAFTPLLRRVRGDLMSSPVQPPAIDKTEKQFQICSHSSFEKHLSSLKNQITPERYADYESIFRNTETLLKAAAHSRNRKGASSFISMCLNKVPNYVAGIRSWEIYEAEKKGNRSNTTGADVGPRIYSELESLGPSDAGWTNLRTLVEADTVAILFGAMEEGLFPDEFSMLLLELCAEYQVSQASVLYDTYLARQYPEPTRLDSKFSEEPELRPLAFLRDISERHGKPSMLFRQISNLLVQGLLPAAWLVTREFESLWALAYRAISKGRAALDAVDFLATSIVLLSKGQASHDIQHIPEARGDCTNSYGRTLNQTLSLLSAMRRLGEDEIQRAVHPNCEKIARICRSLDFTFYACISEINSWKGRRGKPRYLLGLATFLSTPDVRDKRAHFLVANELRKIYDKQVNTAQHNTRFNAIIALLTGIARICGRGTSQAPRHHLSAICEQLGHLELPPEALDDIRKSGAFFLAQESNDLRDLLYAEKLVLNTKHDEAVEGRTEEKGKHTLFDGYKWDETINEWVTVSPAAQKKAPKGIALRSGIHKHTKRRGTRSSDMGPESPTCTRQNGSEAITAGLTTYSGNNISTLVEQPSHRRVIPVSRNVSAIARPTRLSDSTALQQKHINRPSKRRSCAFATKNMAYHDELGDDKENHDKAMTRKRYSEGMKPLTTKQRIQLLKSDHSEDELGL